MARTKEGERGAGGVSHHATVGGPASAGRPGPGRLPAGNQGACAAAEGPRGGRWPAMGPLDRLLAPEIQVIGPIFATIQDVFLLA